jgi:F420H(2)-dependent quinone reductase
VVVASPEDLGWAVVRQVMGWHARIYRATRGVIGHRIPGAPPILLLDTVGAKSGKRRTTPLAYFEDGRDVVVVGSKGGHAKHPSWYHNLRAHPDTTMQIANKRSAVHARVADSDERARLWPQAVAMWADYRSYQERTEREIPLVILEPRA